MRRQKAKFEALVQQKQGGHSNKGQGRSPFPHMNRDIEDTTTEDTKKWVRNLSGTPLTEDQERVEVKKALKKAQCSSRQPSNVSKREYQALKELKEDKVESY